MPPNQINQDFMLTFESESGARVLDHLMREHFFRMPTFTPGDPHMTAYREGQRNVVLSILGMMKKPIEHRAVDRDYSPHEAMSHA